MFDNDITDPDRFDQSRLGAGPARAGRRRRKVAGAAALLLAGGIAGGALAATSSASAAGTSTTSTPSAAAPGPRGRADTATPVRAGEKAQTGAVLATLKAAALKAVPGGTVYRVETDADGAAYEAHMTKADGTYVTVKFNKSLAVTAVQAGMGPGSTTPPASSGAGL